MIDDKLVTMQIWDTAGQERFQSLGVASIEVPILAYWCTTSQTQNHLKAWSHGWMNFLYRQPLQTRISFRSSLLGTRWTLHRLGDKCPRLEQGAGVTLKMKYLTLRLPQKRRLM